MKKTPARFLDIGCGSGIKVLIAQSFFPIAQGLEYDSGYVKSARETLANFSMQESDIIHADALTFRSYDAYDVLYFYKPVHNPQILRTMELYITQNARPGTILIAPYENFENRYENYNCARIDRHIYLAGISQSEADNTKKLSEKTGLCIAHQENPNEKMIPCWHQIVRASRKNGFVSNPSRSLYN